MKKVLILSYFFPPCNLTAANRVGSWYKYLPEYGYYPICITRNWTGIEFTDEQRLQNSGKETKVIVEKHGEIHYLPYNSSLRDKCFEKSKQNSIYAIMSKFLTIWNLVFENFTHRVIPYNNLYAEATKILLAQPDIKHVIISVNPFEQLLFGYLLKKKFPYVSIIADYRDAWNTNEMSNHANKNLFLKKLNIYSERRWLKSYSAVISVSPYYTQRISQFVNVPGTTIYNGFDQELYDTISPKTLNQSFTIVYNGTLYPDQQIEIFISGVKKCIDEFIKINFAEPLLNVIFCGIGYVVPQRVRVEQLVLGYEKYFEFTDRLPKEDAIRVQKSAQLLLMTSYGKLKGIPASKLYEYLAIGRPVLLCPSDKDIIDETLTNCGLKLEANTSNEASDIILQAYNDFLDQTDNIVKPNTQAINLYSTKNQVKNLSELLNKLG